MIGYIEGELLQLKEDRVLILANQIGYEILLPVFVMETLKDTPLKESVALYIYFHQTERQPKPTLIGFNLEEEKEFFQLFISVEAIGPMKAAKALTIPVRDIAAAIETEDAVTLKLLKGIGARTANKIIATLKGKMDKFALIGKTDEAPLGIGEEISQQVYEVLVQQLGYRSSEARKMIKEAATRNRSISTPEELFDEVFRGEKSA